MGLVVPGGFNTLRRHEHKYDVLSDGRQLDAGDRDIFVWPGLPGGLPHLSPRDAWKSDGGTDVAAHILADERADSCPDEGPDGLADESAHPRAVAEADYAADVGAVACAHDSAHAEAVARADPGADEGPDERADGSTHPRAVAEADQHALPDTAAVARAEHTSADARALGVPDASAHAAPGGGTRGRRRRQERSPRPRRVRRSMESRNGGYHNDGYHYRDDCERCAGTVRIRTDDRFRGRDDAPLLHYAKSMLHRGQDLCVEKDGPRRLAAQGLPQVLRGGIGKGQTGAEARTRPHLLLQEKVEPFLPVS